MMQALMQQTPLLISSLLEHAAKFHSDTEIVSRTVESGVEGSSAPAIHRTGWRGIDRRSRRLRRALEDLGVEPGTRVATLAWNGYRHLELYYAVSGMGAVCHTLNPRLFAEQLVYIVGHAEDAWIFVDLTFVPQLEALAPKLQEAAPGLGFVVMTDEAHMPDTSLPGARCYERLMMAVPASAEEDPWPLFDENLASSLCYTSGTTGNPKGVLYSHRSTVLHALGACMADTLGLWSGDSVLPVVPMFHANAWGLPYAAAAAGSKMVFPGAALDGASLYELLDGERVTVAAGVPTVWLALLSHLKAEGVALPHMSRTVIGGAAAPRSMIRAFEEDLGVPVLHSWGMTETSPLGAVGRLKGKDQERPLEERLDRQVKQGRGVYGVEMRLVDDEGGIQPWDGEAQGELQVRGPWVAQEYFKGEGGEILDEDGWFSTGDVATLDPDGYMQITDRAKDVIKSGGEWISSIELENEAMGHPEVAEAAVIGLPHPKWDERPLLVVVPAPGTEPTKDALLEHLGPRVASWWLPDDIAFVEELPHTATGKVSKRQLRQRFEGYELPTARDES